MKVVLPQLQPRQRILLGAVAACVLLLVLIRFLYLPALTRISAQRSTLHDLRVKIADAHVLVSQSASQHDALREAQKRWNVLERRIENGQSVARILEMLSQEAKQHRLELTAVKPRAEDVDQRILTLGPEMMLREVPLTIQLTGRYRPLGEFLAELPNAPFIASVRKLTMTKPQADSPMLQANFVLAVYLAESPASR